MREQRNILPTSEADRQHLGARLRKARNYLGFKQEDAANVLGIPRTALSDIETGRRKVEAIELQRLAKLYRQSVSHFLSDDEEEAPLPANIARLVRQAASMSEQDREELSRFAQYLRTRSTSRQNQT